MKTLINNNLLSLQFVESNYYIGPAQICVHIRIILYNMSATVELLTIIPMWKCTNGPDIFDLFKNYVARTNFIICKLDQ